MHTTIKGSERTMRIAMAFAAVFTMLTLVYTFSVATVFAVNEPVTVTINKMVDGVPATTSNSNSVEFPMLATYTIGGTPGGPSPYGLNPTGFNGDPTPYQAMTGGLTIGDSYSTYETTNENVGTMCSTETPLSPQFALVGYTTGTTYAEAAAATPSLTVPTFSNLTTNQNVIVWNRDCSIPLPPPPQETVTVTIDKHIDGVMATAVNADNSDFTMNATWVTTNIGSGTGQYTLNESNTPNAYEAETVAMASGADYSTSEVADGTVVGETCSIETPTAPHFVLTGYTTGNTYAEAMAATPSLTPPSFTGMTSDKYVIVWNHDCAVTGGQIGGDVNGGTGTLVVTSVDATDTSAIADGTFENGWKYTFNITVPTNETNLALKFSDWIKTVGVGTIPVANKMRFSSLQADNGNAPIMITAANTYPNPDLHITGDLSAAPGLQVQVIVETAVSIGTPDGSYTSTYGVKNQ
jgi:hypothetical protein